MVFLASMRLCWNTELLHIIVCVSFSLFPTLVFTFELKLDTAEERFGFPIPPPFWSLIFYLRLKMLCFIWCTSARETLGSSPDRLISLFHLEMFRSWTWACTAKYLGESNEDASPKSSEHLSEQNEMNLVCAVLEQAKKGLHLNHQLLWSTYRLSYAHSR